MAVEVYKVMFVNQVAVNVIYIYTLAWILTCLKLYPSISLIDDSAEATQPLSQSGWSSQSSHSAPATQTLSHFARVAGAATLPLCQSGWSSHSATQPLCRSHSATLPEWLEEQPLSHSVTLPEWLEQPLSHSATQSPCQSARVAEWLM